MLLLYVALFVNMQNIIEHKKKVKYTKIALDILIDILTLFDIFIPGII